MPKVEEIIVFGTPWVAVLSAILGLLARVRPDTYAKYGDWIRAGGMVIGYLLSAFAGRIIDLAPWAETALPIAFSAILLFTSSLGIRRVENRIASFRRKEEV